MVTRPWPASSSSPATPQLDHSRATRALVEAAARQPAAQVAVRDLQALYPDYPIDVVTEQ